MIPIVRNPMVGITQNESNEGQKKLGASNISKSGYQIAMPKSECLPSKDSSLEARLQHIENYLSNAKKLMKDHPQDGLKVLSLPEYMFDQPIAPRPRMLRHRSGDLRQLSEPDYHRIDTAMRDLSKKNPDILIKVPVAWRKPIERPVTQQQYLFSKGIQNKAHPLHSHYISQWSKKSVKNTSRREKAKDATELGLKTFGDRHAHDFPEITDDTKQLARNTVLTYFNGGRVSKYHKIMGMQEVLNSGEEGNMQFYSGTNYGGIHTLPNGEIATQEICRDHAVNTAKEAGSVHFVNSDGLRPMGTAAKYQNTSVVVHANAVNATADFFNPLQLQKVELIKRAAIGSLATREPLNPTASADGMDLYNINLEK